MKKLIVILLLSPLSVFAAVSFDDATSAETDHWNTNDIASISTTHTADGSNRAAVACVSTRYNTGSTLPTGMACTYDGAAMTSQGQIGGSNVSAVQMFTLINPSTTSGATISCTWSENQAYAAIGVTTYAGVTVGFGTPVSLNSGSDQNPDVTVTSATGNFVQDCLATSGGKPAAATQTSDWNLDVATADAAIGAGQHAAGAASVVMQWDLNAADQANLIAIDIQSVASGLSGWFALFFGAFGF